MRHGFLFAASISVLYVAVVSAQTPTHELRLAPEHVHWVRRTHPEAAPRTATLRRLARDLPDHDAPLEDRVASLDLAAVELGDWEEVIDPGGGDAEQFAACAAEVVELVALLTPRLVGR